MIYDCFHYVKFKIYWKNSIVYPSHSIIGSHYIDETEYKISLLSLDVIKIAKNISLIKI